MFTSSGVLMMMIMIAEMMIVIGIIIMVELAIIVRQIKMRMIIMIYNQGEGP